MTTKYCLYCHKTKTISEGQLFGPKKNKPHICTQCFDADPEKQYEDFNIYRNGEESVDAEIRAA